MSTESPHVGPPRLRAKNGSARQHGLLQGALSARSRLRVGFGGGAGDGFTGTSDAVGSALAALTGELLVAKREHTDLYTLRRRRGPMMLAPEMQWWQQPPLESSTPMVEVAGLWNLLAGGRERSTTR